jgi:choline-sulfatase
MLSASAPWGFMIKRGPHKYCHYPGEEPQLFDTHVDPYERRDLAPSLRYYPAHAALREALRAALLEIVDPEAVDATAKRHQARRQAAPAGPA